MRQVFGTTPNPESRGAALLLLGALSLASGQISAQAAGAGISYSSSKECPDEREFRAQLSLHLRSDPAPLARTIAVDAQQLEERSIARVRFVDENGAVAVRELSAPTCAEVVTAAALVVALAIDSRDKTPPAKSRAQTPHTAPALQPIFDEPPTPSRAPAGLSIQFGAGAVAHMAVTPEPMLGVTGFVGLAERPSWDLRGAFLYAASGTVTRDVRAAEFTLLAGRLDGCALQLLSGPRYLLHPCLAVELGAVQSAGVENERYTSTEQTTFWMAAGPMLRGQAIFGAFGLEAYAGPWFPIVGRESFVFRTGQGELSFHQVPLVGLLFGLNVSMDLD